jgi:hypothetical protein
MKGSRVILGIGVAALAVTLAAPLSHAQCPVPQEFGAQGNGMLTGRIIIDTTTNNYPNNGNEFGSVWDTVQGSAQLSAGPHFAAPGDICPSTEWWDTGGAFLLANSGIQAFFGSPTCFLIQCPNEAISQVTTLLEDTTPDNSNAGFIVYSVDATFAAIRPWDHARTAGISQVPSATAMQTFQHYPAVTVTSSSGPPPTTTLTNNYLDLSLNFHGVGDTAQGSSTIVSYDILAHHGATDPGRLRAAYGLGQIASIPYANAGVAGHQVLVPCPTSAADTFLAVGATFLDPDTPGNLKSILVGKATAVECNPNIATPQPTLERAPQRSRKQMGQIGR